MNHITIYSLNDLQEIFDAEIFISGSQAMMQEEIKQNCWCLSFEKNLTTHIRLNDLLQFIADLKRKRISQLQQNNIVSSVTFYMWFDEMASQLCFDLTSGKNTRPPFGCTLNILQSPESILQKFLDDCQSKIPALSWENLTILNPGDPGFGEDNDDEAEWIQDVYVTTLQ